MTAEGISVHVFEIKLRILCNGKHAPPFLNSIQFLKLFIRNTRFRVTRADVEDLWISPRI